MVEYADYNPQGTTRTSKVARARHVPLLPNYFNHLWFQEYIDDFLFKNILEDNGVRSGCVISQNGTNDAIDCGSGIVDINGSSIIVNAPSTYNCADDGWYVVYAISTGAVMFGYLENSTVQGAATPNDAVLLGYAIRGDGVFSVYSFYNATAAENVLNEQILRINNIENLQTKASSFNTSYRRNVKWSIKGDASAADRRTLKSPDMLCVAINGREYYIEESIEIDLNTAANWDSAETGYATPSARVGLSPILYACEPSTGDEPDLVLSMNTTFPADYTADTSRKIAGMHCLCADVDHNTSLTAWAASTAIDLGETRKASTWDGYLYRATVAGTTSGTEPTWSGLSVGDTVVDGGVTWVKEVNDLEGYLAGDILPTTVWDLLHRPNSDEVDMFWAEELGKWYAIYPDGGYDNTPTVSTNWMDFVDILAAKKQKLLRDHEFQVIAAGSNEETQIAGSLSAATNLGGNSDDYGRRMISNYGAEDCCGHIYQWLDEQGYRGDGTWTYSWEDLDGERGSLYSQGAYGDAKLLAGGHWSYGSGCGSRARAAGSARWSASTTFGARGRAEPRVVNL